VRVAASNRCPYRDRANSAAAIALQQNVNLPGGLSPTYSRKQLDGRNLSLSGRGLRRILESPISARFRIGSLHDDY
jgi:hypothetical protein